jgi:hypothetical protein
MFEYTKELWNLNNYLLTMHDYCISHDDPFPPSILKGDGWLSREMDG